MTSGTHLEVQGLELGPIYHLTDVLVGLIEGNGFVSKRRLADTNSEDLLAFRAEPAIQFSKKSGSDQKFSEMVSN